MNDYLLLILGVVCAGIGGELFVRGAVRVAVWARISPGIIGATVAAFATSSPEFFVALSAARAGYPEIALGDALGSNIVNIAVVLALALVISGIKSSRQVVKRDFTVALAAPVLTGALALDGQLTRIDGLTLLLAFFVWLFIVVIAIKNERNATSKVITDPQNWSAIASGIIGLGFLVGAGSLIVAGAQGIAAHVGVDTFVIAVTLVALGTGTPELATVIISKVRGHDEVGLGTVLGSNIFNGLWIVGVAAVLHPITLGVTGVALVLAFGVAVVALSRPGKNDFIGRGRGALLLAVYVSYLIAIVHLSPT